MSRAKEMLNASRPKRFTGRGDKYLGEIAQELRRVLWKAQQRSIPESIRLTEQNLLRLAVALVEFGEDLHNDIGLWRVIEQRQRDLFGTPLPLVLPSGEAVQLERFDVRRVQYFVWSSLRQMNAHMAISPADLAVHVLAETAAAYLAQRFEKVPRDSGIAKMVAELPESPAMIIDALVWLGAASYPYRLTFEAFSTADPEISAETVALDLMPFLSSIWSGIAPIELLAGIIPDDAAELRNEILSWFESPFTLYRVVSRRDRGPVCEAIQVQQLFTERVFEIAIGERDYALQPEMLCQARLVPIRGKWHWLGRLRYFDQSDPEFKQRITNQMLRDRRAMACLIPERAEHDRATAQSLHAQFLERHGRDLLRVENGPEAVAMLRSLLSSGAAPEAKHSDAPNPPEPEWIRELRETRVPVAVFSSPEEGIEWIADFDALVNAFQKRGKEIEQADAEALFQFVSHPTYSPGFVKRLTSEYGEQAVCDTFCLPEDVRGDALPYLFRSYKAQFYRKHPPKGLLYLDEL